MPEFRTAYGYSDEIPVWISQLSSTDEDVQTDALVCLVEYICPEGTVYDGSLQAIPYLAEHLAKGDPGAKFAAGLITIIGLGKSQSAVLLVKIHREIKPLLSELADFLRDDDSELRENIALLLARYPAQLELFVDRLTIAHDDEADPQVKELMRQSIETLQVKR